MFRIMYRRRRKLRNGKLLDLSVCFHPIWPNSWSLSCNISVDISTWPCVIIMTCLVKLCQIRGKPFQDLGPSLAVRLSTAHAKSLDEKTLCFGPLAESKILKSQAKDGRDCEDHVS